MENNGTIIEIKGLKHIYFDLTEKDELLAINQLDLQVKRNEFLGIVGPSGCGKSTLLFIIAGLIKPTGGSVLMHNKPIIGPGAERGMVFQEYALLPWKTVFENVEIGLRFRGVSIQKRKETVNRVLEVVGLVQFANKYPHQLSGGMKQRVAVARVLANEPEVMLMDEPFAAVDAQTRLSLQEELIRISMAFNTTTILVTHSVEEAAFLSDRVVVLTSRPGKVKEEVSIDIPRYDRIWQNLDQDTHFQALREKILSSVRKEVFTTETIEFSNGVQ